MSRCPMIRCLLICNCLLTTVGAVSAVAQSFEQGHDNVRQLSISSTGGDIGIQINAMEQSLPANGGLIQIPTTPSGQCYSYATPILITKSIILQGQGPSTCLSYTGSGAAISFGNNQVSFVPLNSPADGFGMRDFTLLGSGPNAGQIGLSIGGSQNSAGFYASGMNIDNFGIGLQFARGVWNFKFQHSFFGQNYQSVVWPAGAGYGGENIEFDHVTFAGANFVDSVSLDVDSSASIFTNLSSLTLLSCNFDDAQLHIANGSGSVRLVSPHFENPQHNTSAGQPFVRIEAYTVATDVEMDGPDFYNDANDPYPPSFIEIDGGAIAVISQMRSLNLDGSTNVPTNVLINGAPQVTLIGNSPLRAAQQQYVISPGSNPRITVLGGEDATNNIISAGPIQYTQSYGPDYQSPSVQIGGTGYEPTIGFSLWSGGGSTYYGAQIREGAPGELDFCYSGAAPSGGGNYICNAAVSNGVFKSLVPDGTAPLSVVSHTPPDNLNAWPATFHANGVQVLNPHVTSDKVILLPSGTATVNFSGPAAFTQTPSCTVAYQTSFSLGLARTLSSNPTSNSITIFGQPYYGVYFQCFGN